MKDTIKPDVNKPLVKFMMESAKRKQIIREYIKAGKPLSDLKGISFATPV